MQRRRNVHGKRSAMLLAYCLKSDNRRSCVFDCSDYFIPIECCHRVIVGQVARPLHLDKYLSEQSDLGWKLDDVMAVDTSTLYESVLQTAIACSQAELLRTSGAVPAKKSAHCFDDR